MTITITPHQFSGDVIVPASKSHTIRRLLVATLANGDSCLQNPLDSFDAASCVAVCRGLGADINTDNPAQWYVHGTGGAEKMRVPEAALDVGNSGTTFFFTLALSALAKTPFTFTGDSQIARRSALPLLDALKSLGVKISCTPQGCIPITVQGPMKSGRISLPSPTSQYLSAMLLAAPLAPAGTLIEIDVPLLNEKPYIEMTLGYLKAQNIIYETNDDFSYFRLNGGASYRPVSGFVPGDFSSAAFPAAAGVITGGEVILHNLDPSDFQGDKAFFDILSAMGCQVKWEKSYGKDTACPWRVCVSRQGSFYGGVFDLNATPDMLPVVSVLAAFAEGETRLVNVAHARIKETDRISCMAQELSKLGVVSKEMPDGLVIQGQGGVKGGDKKPLTLDGHGDHRIVMALAVAALGADGPVEITGAEAAGVTYPGFLDLIRAS
ncbi:MAG: 3-phosphoshikimate 1-carboxyvinyltransferase [Spirochaetaceae bacterium]|jgi:3-phosphoshikimate 1-carboxyvinyltransferase|nr:3-phosphoshikimate 1-carboxyvinyltransferase [Spirochaetaceae bacterium]